MKYFRQRRERAREEAGETLRRLRGFYSEENDILGLYISPLNHLSLKDISYFSPEDAEKTLNKARNLVNFKVQDRGGNEDSVRSLQRIKKSIWHRSGYTFEYTLQKVEDYFNTPEEEKERMRAEIEKKFRGEQRGEKFKSPLESWIDSAEPVLSRILEECPEGMNGFHYSHEYDPAGGSWADSTTDREIMLKDGTLYTLEVISSWGVEHKREYESNSSRLAQEVLNRVRPPNPENFRTSSDYAEDKNPYQTITSLNKKRNNLVREIEKRTGRNLKKEVYEVRKKMKEK